MATQPKTDSEKIQHAKVLLWQYRAPHRIPLARQRSEHQQRVDEFMRLADQEVPLAPVIPNEKTRILRAKLILEEALETIREGLGVDVLIDHGNSIKTVGFGNVIMENLDFNVVRDADLEQIADGCADLMVVTTGTLSACGIADEALQHEIDCNNLQKFGPGGHKREDGKWVKPKDHPLPQTGKILKEQTYK